MAESGARRGPALDDVYPFTRWLIPTHEQSPRRQKFLLGDRMQTTALPGLEGLAEATFSRNRGRLLDRANIDLDRLWLLIRLSKVLGDLDARRYEHAARQIGEVGRSVGGWRKAHGSAAD